MNFFLFSLMNIVHLLLIKILKKYILHIGVLLYIYIYIYNCIYTCIGECVTYNLKGGNLHYVFITNCTKSRKKDTFFDYENNNYNGQI